MLHAGITQELLDNHCNAASGIRNPLTAPAVVQALWGRNRHGRLAAWWWT